MTDDARIKECPGCIDRGYAGGCPLHGGVGKRAIPWWVARPWSGSWSWTRSWTRSWSRSWEDVVGRFHAPDLKNVLEIQGVTSPIEEAFAVALDLVARAEGQTVAQWAAPRDGDLVAPNEWGVADDVFTRFLVTPQAEIGSLRVDFLVVCQEPRPKVPEPLGDWRSKVIVECDGHDYHERTKEQARRDRSRDRWLQDQGYRVYRFTGAEIYADPFACAKQVVDIFCRPLRRLANG